MRRKIRGKTPLEIESVAHQPCNQKTTNSLKVDESVQRQSNIHTTSAHTLAMKCGSRRPAHSEEPQASGPEDAIGPHVDVTDFGIAVDHHTWT